MTANAEVIQLLPGDLPAIRLLTRGRDLKGSRRHHLQQLTVRDPILYARLSAEVKKGEEIKVTIVTEWTEDDYAAYLADSARIAGPNVTVGPPATITAA